MASVAGSLYSADPPVTRRRVNARVGRLAREADSLEQALLGALTDELFGLQAEIREVLTSRSRTPFAVALADVERRVALRTSAMVLVTVDGVSEAAARGAGIIDELVAMVGAPVGLASPAHAELVNRIGRQARILIARATDLVTMATSSQLALLQGDRQDLAATLEAVGTQLEGSVVFGRAAERLTGATLALTGDAFGEAQEARALEVETALQDLALERKGRRPSLLLKRWISSHKRDARDSHRDAEARYGPGGSVGPIPYGEDFRVGSWRTPWPRGPGLPGAQKIHCGCRLVPVLADSDALAAQLSGSGSTGSPRPPASPPGGTGGAGGGPGGPGGGGLDDVRRELDEHYRLWADGLTPGERSALSAWQSTDRFYQKVQGTLRGDLADPITAANRRRVERTIEGLATATRVEAIPRDLTVYRGIRRLERLPGIEGAEDLVGLEITEPGFLATTIDPGVATGQFTGAGGAIMQIAVPGGHPAAWIPLVSRRALVEQLELLLPDGVTLKIVAVRPGSPPTLICQVVP